jgi:hypothetical protein
MSRSEVVRSIRQRLGPVGVWLLVLSPAPIEQARQAVRRIEELGYGSIWTRVTAASGDSPSMPRRTRYVALLACRSSGGVGKWFQGDLVTERFELSNGTCLSRCPTPVRLAGVHF